MNNITILNETKINEEVTLLKIKKKIYGQLSIPKEVYYFRILSKLKLLSMIKREQLTKGLDLIKTI